MALAVRKADDKEAEAEAEEENKRAADDVDADTEDQRGGGGPLERPPVEAFGKNRDGNEKRKKKIALFFGYNGDGYQGMQRNPGAKTIEDDLEKAIVLAGGIAETNAGDFGKVHWNRAARTDKGVSAVGQVVSFK